MIFFTVEGSDRVALAVAMSLVPITALTGVRQSLVQGLGRPTVSQLPEQLVRPLVLLIGLSVFWALDRSRVSPGNVILLGVGASFVALLYGGVLLRRSVPVDVRSATPRYAVRQWLTASVPMMLLGASWLVSSYATIVLLGLLADQRAVGEFSVISSLAVLTSIPLSAVLIPYAPEVARLHHQRDGDGLRRSTRWCARITFACAVPIAGLLVVFRADVLRLFGSGFTGAAVPLALLAGGEAINCAAGPVATLLMMTGNERNAAMSMLLGSITLVVAGVALIPAFGVSGAAAANVLSLTVWNVSMVGKARRCLGVSSTVFGGKLSHRLRASADE
jgi:O-antigen/teichoic acid export membrane protein